MGEERNFRPTGYLWYTSFIMKDIFQRTKLLFGEEAMGKLKRSRVAVFGIGGVGGYVVEALARSGIGALDLIDSDTVDITNLNRQIIATQSTVGRPKVEVAKERVLDINPDCTVRTHRTFFLPETKDGFDFSSYDYVVDAIDTVSGKVELIKCAKEAGVPVISAMGAGNKLEASMLEVSDISKTSVCPLAKVMRKKLKDEGITKLKVVYSKETPLKPEYGEDAELKGSRPAPGSNTFVPGAMGLIIAGEVVKDLTK